MKSDRHPLKERTELDLIVLFKNFIAMTLTIRTKNDCTEGQTFWNAVK